ncbi:MAG: hydrogenase maturation protease [Dehalococcoidia bacterium]|nr:MAG: hydrogenase maturation protease [Dehalococcoidia bacterium]
MKTLILGIGNPILGDDGVGFHIAQELAEKIKDENIEVKDTTVNGLNLLELIAGYDKLIVIDAIMTEDGKAGEIYKLKPESIGEPACSTISAHHLNLANTIELGKRLFPQEMPEEVTVFAVGTQKVAQVTEEMTEAVKEAIPKIVSLVLEEISSTSVA